MAITITVDSPQKRVECVVSGRAILPGQPAVKLHKSGWLGLTRWVTRHEWYRIADEVEAGFMGEYNREWERKHGGRQRA